MFLTCESSRLRDYNRCISCVFARNSCYLRCLTKQLKISNRILFKESKKESKSRKSDFRLNSPKTTFHARYSFTVIKSVLFVAVATCCFPRFWGNQLFQNLLTLGHFSAYGRKCTQSTNKWSTDLDTAKIELFSHIFFNLDDCVGQELPSLRLDFSPLLYVQISKMLFKDITLLFLANRAEMASKNVLTLHSFWSYFRSG